jgi:hypothetical protein
LDGLPVEIRKQKRSVRTRNRGEGGLEFPKDLYIKSEKCWDLFVK